jgi:hypothetical protein
LEEKYGPLPSLLATRADYVDSPEEREYLLLRAYEQARALNDLKNLVEIAESLASFYIEDRTIATERTGIGRSRSTSSHSMTRPLLRKQPVYARSSIERHD